MDKVQLKSFLGEFLKPELLENEQLIDAMVELEKKLKSDIISNIPRYDAYVGGCSCCGNCVEFEHDKRGEYVKFDELNDFLK
jgi:hypothetical protein